MSAVWSAETQGSEGPPRSHDWRVLATFRAAGLGAPARRGGPAGASLSDPRRDGTDRRASSRSERFGRDVPVEACVLTTTQAEDPLIDLDPQTGSGQKMLGPSRPHPQRSEVTRPTTRILLSGGHPSGRLRLRGQRGAICRAGSAAGYERLGSRNGSTVRATHNLEVDRFRGGTGSTGGSALDRRGSRPALDQLSTFAFCAANSASVITP